MELAARVRETRNECKSLSEKLKRNTRGGWKDSNKIDLSRNGVWDVDQT
jgi:hypothetical protein